MNHHRIYLNVPYSERLQAKRYGAWWDPRVRKGYARFGELQLIKRWGKKTSNCFKPQRPNNASLVHTSSESGTVPPRIQHTILLPENYYRKSQATRRNNTRYEHVGYIIPFT